MTGRKTAPRSLRMAGVLLMALGVLHLAATPHIPELLNAIPSAAARHRAVGPTLLNHVLVGFLLLPFGYTTWLAAADRNIGESWARRTLVVNALTLLTLPISVALCMREPEYYRAPLFLAGVAMVATVSLLVLVSAAVILRRD